MLEKQLYIHALSKFIFQPPQAVPFVLIFGSSSNGCGLRSPPISAFASFLFSTESYLEELTGEAQTKDAVAARRRVTVPTSRAAALGIDFPAATASDTERA